MDQYRAERIIYDRLWQEALDLYPKGQIHTDPHLLDRASDRRSGITLIARPDQPVIDQISRLVETLREQEPDQHFYRPDEFHLTVLSLITVADGFDIQNVPVESYRVVFGELFKDAPPLTIDFTGITASADSVMIQGFCREDSLNTLRDAIRQRLGQAGLAGTLDVRYRITTAHATIMRFRAPARNLPGLLASLSEWRQHDFGSTTVGQIEFVVNDWYMSFDKVRVLARCDLKKADPAESKTAG